MRRQERVIISNTIQLRVNALRELRVKMHFKSDVFWRYNNF